MNCLKGGIIMARPRQPVDLIQYKGKKHLTKAEIEERKNSEVKANSDNIVAPDILSDEQKEKFYDIANELIEIGIMSNLDTDTLARFIIHQTEYEKVTIQLQQTELEFVDEYDDLLKLQEKHFKMARQCSTDLGLTIASRCKLVVPQKEDDKPENKFDKFAK